jgi:hypothetical protein
MDTFLEFVAKSKAAGKIKDIELFMKNSVSSWKAIEKVGYDISQIEKL